MQFHASQKGTMAEFYYYNGSAAIYIIFCYDDICYIKGNDSYLLQAKPDACKQCWEMF